MAAATKLKGWPDPWSPIDKATAGALIGVSRDTIERVAKRVRDGEPLPKVRKPLAIPIGKLFGEEEPGSPVLAERIYKVLKVNPAKLSGPIIKPPAARAAPAAPKPGAVPSQAELDGMSDTDLAKVLSSTVAKARAQDGGRVPWRRIKVIAEELSARNRPPGGMLHGQPIANIDLDKVETWGFLGVFAARAEPGDLWPFVLPPNGERPIDLLSALDDDIRYGTIVALSLEKWLDLMINAVKAKILIIERDREQSAILKGSPMSNSTKKIPNNRGM